MSTNPESKSPQWIKRLLTFFLTERLAEACLGDLEEKFQTRISKGVLGWKAKLQFITEGLAFLRMARLPKRSSGQTTFNLLSHTFLFFSRLVRKDIGYYLVSLLGLTLSLTSFIFMMMFIRDELSYDQFHQNKDRLHRLITHLKLGDVEYNMVTSAFPAATAIRTEMPEVENVVRILPQQREFNLGNNTFTERIVMADDPFFDVFSFEWLAGNKGTAMKDPASIILTEAMARKYFGNENPIGKTVITEGNSLKVTGVIGNVPEQSHLKFKAIVPLTFQLNVWKLESGVEGRENKWFWIGAYTYVLLRDTVSPEDAQTNLVAIVNKYFPDRYKEHGELRLQSLNDIHLTSNLSNEMEPPGNIMYVRLFSVVALVIMVVSAINLINLSSFKIGSRVREVGIRKFLGQNASRIVVQLAVESTLLGVLAFILALILCQTFLTGFNALVQKNISMFSVPNLLILSVTFFILIFICFVSVIRPAFRYASKSSRFLLYERDSGRRHAAERNVLIGFQVGFSFVLLVFSFVVNDQIRFFRNKDLGFDKHNVLSVELNEDFNNHVEAFKSELKKSNLILDVSGGAEPGEAHNGWRFVPEGGSMEKPFLMPLAWVDNDFLATLKIRLLEGENFKRGEAYDQQDTLWPFLINKTAVLELGWADDPINKKLKVFAAGTTEIMAEGKVIGVIDDYNFESLHRPVKPVILTISSSFGSALIRTSGNSFGEAVSHIEKTWKKFSAKPFAYEMLDRKLEKLYTNESKLSNIILFFTVITLYLTCYGMFAMSSLLFSSRLKEVAIRKVLGADQVSIINQFYSRYAVFNVVAIVAACPVALYLGNEWLQTFQYRITLDSTSFLKAALCIMVVGMLSVSYYLFRVAFSNPVKFLKRE